MLFTGIQKRIQLCGMILRIITSHLTMRVQRATVFCKLVLDKPGTVDIAHRNSGVMLRCGLSGNQTAEDI